MKTPLEESLAAALRARFGEGPRVPESRTISLDRLTLDYPGSSAEVDHQELADALALALDDLLSEPR